MNSSDFANIINDKARWVAHAHNPEGQKYYRLALVQIIEDMRVFFKEELGFNDHEFLLACGWFDLITEVNFP